jgi:hypothetical protein
MKKQFIKGRLTAKYDDTTELWNVDRANLRIAVIYDDAASVRFTSDEETHDLEDLKDLAELIALTHSQYEKLNP